MATHEKQLEAQLMPLLNFFDGVRIVDPQTHDVIMHKEQQTKLSHVPKDTCYAFWKKHAVCENCIAMQALRTQTATEKLEYVDGTIFLVLATPVSVGTESYIVEALRNISDSTIIEKIKQKTRNEIQNEINDLNEQLIKDQLTSCYNRTYLFNRLPVLLIQQTLNVQKKLAVAVFDLDNFKEINDTFGHIVGDKILRKIGESIRSVIHPHAEWMVRIGGDEFVFILEAATEQIVINRVASMIKAIEETCICIQNSVCVSIQTSVGITFSLPDDTCETILARADQIMYENKRMKKQIQK
ncbi:MAG: GGDEF domain-containing protein [Culicoidibacterales bacterium]